MIMIAWLRHTLVALSSYSITKHLPKEIHLQAQEDSSQQRTYFIVTNTT